MSRQSTDLERHLLALVNHLFVPLGGLAIEQHRTSLNEAHPAAFGVELLAQTNINGEIDVDSIVIREERRVQSTYRGGRSALGL